MLTPSVTPSWRCSLWEAALARGRGAWLYELENIIFCVAARRAGDREENDIFRFSRKAGVGFGMVVEGENFGGSFVGLARPALRVCVALSPRRLSCLVVSKLTFLKP